MPTDSWERARRLLSAGGLDAGALTAVRPLGGGTYNEVEEVRLADGTRYVLKVPPPETVPGLAHERRLLVSEAEFCRAAAAVAVPVPRVVAATGRELLMTACPGDPWDETLPDADRRRLRTELGRGTALLHTVTGPGFGYPSGALGPLAADWRTAFTGMLDAVLDDARRYRPWLPRPLDAIAGPLRAALGALDAVTEPRLVHFDLWPGNILVDRSGAEPRIGGLIDGERMFWGDPVADLVSTALLGDIAEDADFLAGYREAGGVIGFDPATRLRLALYRAYLYLIMLTETVPRAADEDGLAWRRQYVGPQLEAALDEISGLGR
ncbi:aminoglycoside phosphotransferase family protein [Streptomyces sp. NPDC000983]|uniref:phosphotransferase family protein n=1 Tax=Streptomyces sp. NPDC000983 TaxID=3154373 RepID=UPI003324FC2E